MLLLVLGVVAVLGPALFQGQVPVLRDILHTTLPLGSYLGARLRAGQLPQWFPFEGLGEPFIGQVNESAFHPATWLFAVFSGVNTLRLQMFLVFSAAAVGQLLLARRLGFSLCAAAVAGVLFAFSGYPISLSNLLPYLWGMASLPWVGLCAANVLTRERPWPWVSLLALTWATALVAGDSHSALFGGLVVVAVGLALGDLRRIPLCLLASALALGLAGAELVPVIDVVSGGSRSNWHGSRFLSFSWALHPYRLPELLLPGWMPSRVGTWFGMERFRENGRWAVSIYAGAAPVALAALGLLRGGRRGRVFGLLAVLGLWLALGGHGGLELWIRRLVPLLNILRFPEKHLAVWTFGLSLAAGAGLDAASARPKSRFSLGLLALAVPCAIAALLLPRGLPLSIWPQLQPEMSGAIHAAWRSAFLATAGSLVAAGGLLALGRAGARLLVPAALFVELWAASAGTIAFAPQRTLEAVPRFCRSAAAAGATPAGTRVLGVPRRNPTYDGTEDAARWVSLERNMLQPDSSSLCGIGSLAEFWTLSNEPRDARAIFGFNHLESNPALQLYGFGLVVRSEPGQHVPDETLVDGLATDAGSYALVRRPAAPRAYAAAPRWVPDAASARAAVKKEGLALRDHPVLIGDGPHFLAEGPVGSVRIVSYQPEHVALDATMARAGAVVLNDLFAKGWTASLDGEPARLYNANALVRAVLVPAGAHRLEMVYALPGLRQGLAVSGGALLVCLALVATGLRRRPSPDERTLQREYWSAADPEHLRWQTGNAFLAATEKRLLDQVAAAPGERFLEVGCGDGANLANLGPRIDGARLFAVDFSLPKAGLVGRSGVHAACADATRLPFASCSFDSVLIRDLLHHVPDRGAVLEEAARVLKPGGRLVLIEPNGKNPIMAAMALAIRAERGMLASSPARALEEARAAGFVDVVSAPRQPFPISRIVLHYRFGLPSLAKLALARRALGWAESAARILPSAIWGYFVLRARRPGR
ncbi:MAG: hypothetical protein NVS4B10_05100 [Myxococcales bacterium]